MQLSFLAVDVTEAGKLDLPPTSHVNKASSTVYSALAASTSVIEALENTGLQVARFTEQERVKITAGTLSVQTIGGSSNLYLTANDLGKLDASRAGGAQAQRGGSEVAAAYILSL